MTEPVSQRSDMALVADLIDSNPAAAKRLAAVVDRALETEARLRAVEYELRFLRDLAREIPVGIERDDSGEFKSAFPAQEKPGVSSYVLKNCPRLVSIMAGEIPSLGKV